jgi:Mg-chelatase subunit ChlD
MAVPHRRYSQLVGSLRDAMRADPDFAARACVFMHMPESGVKIRDQQDSAIIALLQAPAEFAQYREAGRCLLAGSDVYPDVEPACSGVPPFRFFRIVQYMASPFVVTDDGKELSRFSAMDAAQRFAGQRGADVARDLLHVRANRQMRGIVGDYLRNLEGNASRFDGVAVLNRRAMTWAYEFYHVAPSALAQAVLFDNEPPPGSKLAVLKEIANTNDIRTQIRLVIENRIPYTVAASVLPKMSPAVAIALIERMSPSEALNSRAWVERSGILDVPEVRQAYEGKLVLATASIATAEHRVSAQGRDAGLQAVIDTAKERAVVAGQKIEKDTLLLVDASGSMERAIEVGREFAYRIAAQCAGGLVVYAFQDRARQVRGPEENSLAGWRQAFQGVRAGGRTSIESGLSAAMRDGFVPEQVVIITDGQENVGDYTRALRALERDLDAPVQTVLLLVGTIDNVVGRRVRQGGHLLEEFRFTGDYNVFDNIVALLGGPPAMTVVDRILSTEFPRRASWADRWCL